MAGRIVVFDQAVWFVDSVWNAPWLGEGEMEGSFLTKVKHNLLIFTEGDGREVGHVRSGLDVFESHSQAFVVSIVSYFFCVEVNECSNYVPCLPLFPKRSTLLIPLFDPRSIPRIRCLIISDSIFLIKRCCECAPAYLHDSLTQKAHLVIVRPLKYSCIRTYRVERACTHNLVFISHGNVSLR